MLSPLHLLLDLLLNRLPHCSTLESPSTPAFRYQC